MSGVLGPYRLLKRLGAGGMGEVWEAEPREGGGAHVALKTMSSASEGESNTLRKFIAEARIGQGLEHRNIVKVHDAGVDGHRAWISMELLEGRTLARLPKEPLPVPLVVELARQALTALDTAHTFIVHRDLKPSNLFLTRQGVLKLIDFGIAMWSDLERTRTATGMMRGSLPYSTPEQARNEPTDARSDLFSLGLVLHELLTGERVLKGDSDAAIVTALLMLPVPRVSASRADVPEGLDLALAWALERDREKRPPTARALLEKIPSMGWGEADLAAWLARQPVLEEAPPSPGTQSLPVAVPAPVPVPVPTRRSFAVPMMLAVMAVTALGAGAFFALRPAEPALVPPPAPAPIVVAEPEPEPEPEDVAMPDAGAVAPTAPATKRGTGWLTVDARPTWGTVFIDGKKFGPTPLYRQVLPAGRHVVEVQKADGTRKQRKVSLASGREQQVVVTW